MSENRNMLLAVLLSVAILAGWQYFYVAPREKAQQAAQQQNRIEQSTGTTTANKPAEPAGAAQSPGSSSPTPSGTVAPAAAVPATREAALAASPRIVIDTPRIKGTIALRGGSIDDLALKDYHETVDPKSPNIVLMSPAGGPEAFYAEYGWVAPTGASIPLPNAETVWTEQGNGTLTPSTPVTLTWDNGQGLTFTRTIAVDDNYLFTVTDKVANATSEAVTLYPYALVARHGRPHTLGYYLLHEGLLGWLGDDGLQEIKYKKIDDEKSVVFHPKEGWLGITDKYWAASLIPPQGQTFTARFSSTGGDKPTYQTDYLLDAQKVAPGGEAQVSGRLFAGAKEVRVINDYRANADIPRFDLMIDWGWFYFLTKPMFWLLDTIFHFVGNFGVSILIVTVLVKLVFFPLANMSYVSMSKMKKLQPEMQRLKERYKDDRAAQQREMMDIYKKEKINPMAGCVPILLQIPVFFALYKVIFITIEMRHAPFFGWIHDLSAPDPTSIFNLFGLLPFDPGSVPVIGHFLMLGIWPILMGFSMFVQMRLNPLPPDPTQAMIFTWMPVFFTFLLASFPAGLVIYWTWNNTLSCIQQSVIMKRQGVKVELWDNLKSLFRRKPKTQSQ